MLQNFIYTDVKSVRSVVSISCIDQALNNRSLLTQLPIQAMMFQICFRIVAGVDNLPHSPQRQAYLMRQCDCFHLLYLSVVSVQSQVMMVSSCDHCQAMILMMISIENLKNDKSFV